ncbi:MAG TPA: hypothetical protein ENN54_04660 [Thermoplasmatales archaeon]|nr:hypothetical protein [Thermoplasmatales archaeon]
MKTCLTVIFNSEGALPSQIRDRLMALGLQATQGSYDFVYQWKEEPDVDMLLMLADRIHTALRDTGASFSLETI